MEQQDEQSLESLQACVEVSPASPPAVASVLPCVAPQPEPWNPLCSILRDLIPNGQQLLGRVTSTCLCMYTRVSASACACAEARRRYQVVLFVALHILF